MSEEVFQAKGNLMKSIQIFLEKFNCISFGEKPKVLLQAWEKYFAIQHAQPEDTNELFQKLLEDLQIINEELAEYINSPKLYFFEYTSQISPVHAIAPVPPTEEPEYSLSMGYEHLSTTSKMESDEVIESSVKNLVPIPSECEVTSDNENELTMSYFLTRMFRWKISKFIQTLFLMMKINSDDIDSHYFNVESDLIESLSNRDTLFDSSPKFDYLEEFSGELMPTSIVNEERILREHEEYISLMEKLLAINSFPRPMENSHANTINETLSTSPILIKDIDSLREGIDIFTGTDDLLHPGIESGDYDSEEDIHFLEEMLSNSISLPENESFNFDHQDDPSFPPEPPDVEFLFDFEPNSGEVISVVINNIDELNEDE
nr:hypothetical protein [Tanacetum cinerariifolium]